MINIVNMFTKKDKDQDPDESQYIERGRGRPRGTTQQGLAMRQNMCSARTGELDYVDTGSRRKPG